MAFRIFICQYYGVDFNLELIMIGQRPLFSKRKYDILPLSISRLRMILNELYKSS